MERIYCKNCKWCRNLDFITEGYFQCLCKDSEIRKLEEIACIYYKRKWWKFWI